MPQTVWAYNLFEACLWSAVAFFFLICACRPREKHRLFCLYGALSFLYFAASEVIEMHTGAWWRPPALFAMKVSCNLFILSPLIWWVRIQGGWQNALDVARGRRPLR